MRQPPPLPPTAFHLGKHQQGDTVKKPGQPILIDGEGNLIDKDFETPEAAVAEARRLARKTEDDVYVYVASKRVGPSEPKVEEVDL